MYSKHAILWDLDGTLLPSRQIAYDVWSRVFSELNITMPDQQIFADDFGMHLSSFIEKHAGTQADRELLLKNFLEYQLAHYDNITFYGGSHEVIGKFHANGFKQAVVSSRGQQGRGKAGTRSIVESSVIAPYISHIVSGDDVNNHKPHPEPLLLALKGLQVKPENSIMVGDNVVDIVAGKQAGTYTIGVNHDRSQNTTNAMKEAGVDGIAYSMDEIFAIADRLLRALN